MGILSTLKRLLMESSPHLELAGERKRGRPSDSLRWDVMDDSGYLWGELEKKAKDRRQWRHIGVNGLSKWQIFTWGNHQHWCYQGEMVWIRPNLVLSGKEINRLQCSPQLLSWEGQIFYHARKKMGKCFCFVKNHWKLRKDTEKPKVTRPRFKPSTVVPGKTRWEFRAGNSSNAHHHFLRFIQQWSSLGFQFCIQASEI
jgi:hypothetical protein